MLWVHGLGESSLCFAQASQAPALQRFRHRLVDLPGYGRSPWPAQPYTLADAAAALERWLAHEDQAAVVIGHSMGGVIAQLLAERAPDRVRALINVEGNLSEEDCAFSGRAAAVELAPFVEYGFDELRDWVYRKGLGSGALRGYYASMRFADPRVFHLHSRELVTYSRVEDLAARAAQLPMPALYLAGVPDGVCARSRELLSAAGARWQEIAPAGHWPFLDRVADFTTALAGFLDEAVPATTAAGEHG
jgi:pimeloyl-ACP methyl ester carboxylesterase